MLVSVPAPYNYMLASLADFRNQDMSGNYFPSRTKILLLFMLTDNPLDTQGEVGRPSKVVLQEQAFTHLLSFYLDVTKLDLNAQ